MHKSHGVELQCKKKATTWNSLAHEIGPDLPWRGISPKNINQEASLDCTKLRLDCTRLQGRADTSCQNETHRATLTCQKEDETEILVRDNRWNIQLVSAPPIRSVR